MDLQVAPGPGIPDGLTIAESDLTERFSRSSGPGGQSVNTTDSRVELVFDITTSTSLSESQRNRLLRRLDTKLVNGALVVVASEHRSQHRNRTAARERLASVVRHGLAPPPPPRRPTKPTKGSQRRRIEAKKRRGQIKSLRGRVTDS